MDGFIPLIWTLICSVLVLFMLPGFAMMETGFTRAKNAGHTMAMNMMVFPVALAGYWVIGYGLQMGGKGFFLSSGFSEAGAAALFLSRAVTMNVAVTIPAGAMAERWTFKSFVYTALFVSLFTYPLLANWIWSGGWLSQLGTRFGLGHGVVDFAGSGVVHVLGGVAGLAGALVLGPRTGKFRADGTPAAIPGHNVPLAVTGCLLLFVGWFGFTGGPAAGAGISRAGLVFVNTALASASAGFSAMCYMWLLYGKPDISLSANGLLGGLAAISASCAYVSPSGAVIIGFIAGILCCASVFFIEQRLKIDDPVGAISVHGTCGAWGIIGLGLFADGSFGEGWNGVPGAVTGLFHGSASQLGAQGIGLIVTIVFVFISMYAFFTVLNRFVPLRAPQEAEFEGLDQSEVAVTAYPDFTVAKRR